MVTWNLKLCTLLWTQPALVQPAMGTTHTMATRKCLQALLHTKHLAFVVLATSTAQLTDKNHLPCHDCSHTLLELDADGTGNLFAWAVQRSIKQRKVVRIVGASCIGLLIVYVSLLVKNTYMNIEPRHRSGFQNTCSWCCKRSHQTFFSVAQNIELVNSLSFM